MNKKQLLQLKKRILLVSGAGIITISSLAGCQKGIPNKTVSELIQSEYYNPEEDSNMFIITTSDNGVYLTKRMSISELSLCTDGANYLGYLNPEKANADNTYAYIDIFSNQVVAVKYKKKENNIFKEGIEKIAYLNCEIKEEKPASNYITKYLGEKNSYSKDELETMINSLQSEIYFKKYTKN